MADNALLSPFAGAPFVPAAHIASSETDGSKADKSKTRTLIGTYCVLALLYYNTTIVPDAHVKAQCAAHCTSFRRVTSPPVLDSELQVPAL